MVVITRRAAVVAGTVISLKIRLATPRRAVAGLSRGERGNGRPVGGPRNTTSVSESTRSGSGNRRVTIRTTGHALTKTLGLKTTTPGLTTITLGLTTITLGIKKIPLGLKTTTLGLSKNTLGLKEIGQGQRGTALIQGINDTVQVIRMEIECGPRISAFRWGGGRGP
jgi:hypothetical protein